MDRKPALAGSWYPNDPQELNQLISAFIDDADLPEIDGRIRGIISPHAGYLFSGPVAAYGYKAVMQQKERFKGGTVIMLGLNHRTPGISEICIWPEGNWISPLGSTQVNQEIASRLLEKLGDDASTNTQVHINENSLETQLPFLQFALDGFKIVPIVFGRQSYAASRKLAEALMEFAERDDILIVASTDLSHYHPDSTARKMDRRLIDAILECDILKTNTMVGSGQAEACGFGTVLTLLQLADTLGIDDIIELKYGTSGDVPHGQKDQVVGYTSIALIDKGDNPDSKKTSNEKKSDDEYEYSLNREQKTYLLELARNTIEQYVAESKTYNPEEPDDPKLTEDGAVFVTLNENGRLRGCIGQMMASQPLYTCVRDMAISAASRDYRFQPVSENELDKIDIEISVLSPMVPIDDWKDIQLGKHGVWLLRGNRSGVFLPQVATDTGWSLEYFLEELSSQKAGLPRDAYKDPDTDLYVFTVVKFDEQEMGLK